jgi:hemolysin activation/secretion protein
MVKTWVQPLWCQLLKLGVILTLGTFSTLCPKGALAQNPNPVPPNPITPQRPERPIPVPQPIPESPLEPPSPTAPKPEEHPDLPGNVTVERFEFEGNTAFSDQILATVTAPFVQRSITFAELLQAEAAITKHYIDAGYINSGAVILAGQAFLQTGAVIKIQVIEGGLEEIQVTGTKRLKPNYVRSRLKLATAKPLNQKRLLKALQVLQLDPLIQSISADLSAGSRPELSVLNVKVKEAKSFKAEFFADNARTPSVGSFRRGVRVNEGNVLGFGDALGVEYANTNGSNALNLNYKVPVNARNGSVAISGGVSFTNVIEEPFNNLDIKGDSYFVDLSFRQPIVQTPTQEFALGITASGQESHTQLLGINYPLSPGADASGTTQIAALRFFG